MGPSHTVQLRISGGGSRAPLQEATFAASVSWWRLGLLGFSGRLGLLRC